MVCVDNQGSVQARWPHSWTLNKGRSILYQTSTTLHMPGVVLWELITGEVPVRGHTREVR